MCVCVKEKENKNKKKEKEKENLKRKKKKEEIGHKTSPLSFVGYRIDRLLNKSNCLRTQHLAGNKDSLFCNPKDYCTSRT